MVLRFLQNREIIHRVTRVRSPKRMGGYGLSEDKGDFIANNNRIMKSVEVQIGWASRWASTKAADLAVFTKIEKSRGFLVSPVGIEPTTNRLRVPASGVRLMLLRDFRSEILGDTSAQSVRFRRVSFGWASRWASDDN